MLEFLEQLLQGIGRLIASGITNQVEGFVFGERILPIRDSGALENCGNAGHARNRTELGKTVEVLVDRGDWVL